MSHLIHALPNTPVVTNTWFMLRLRAVTEEVGLASVVVRYVLPPHLFDDVSVVDLAFNGTDATGLSTNGPNGVNGLLTISGARLSSAPGEQELIELRMKAIAPHPSGLPITVEVLEAIGTDGRRFSFSSITDYLQLDASPLTIETASDVPNGQVGVRYHKGLQAGGGNKPFTWSLHAGTLPQGLTLHASGLINGTPQQKGSSAFQVKVKDSSKPVALEAVKNFSIKVIAEPLKIITQDISPAAPGVDYSFSLTSSGGEGAITWGIGSLPEGLFLQNGVIRGMLPVTYETYGEIRLVIEATDSGNPQQRTTKEIKLNTVPLLPKAEISVLQPTAIAAGRDLVLVDYQLDTTVNQSRAQRDLAFESRIEEHQLAIVEELIYLEHEPCFELPEPSPGDPFSDPFDDRTQRCRDRRKEELKAWYKVLDETKKSGGAYARYDLSFEIDGDEIARVKTGGIRATRIRYRNTAASAPHRDIAAEKSSNTGFKPYRTLFALVRKPLLRLVKSKLDKIIRSSENPGDDFKNRRDVGIIKDDVTTYFNNKNYSPFFLSIKAKRELRAKNNNLIWSLFALGLIASALAGGSVGVLASGILFATFLGTTIAYYSSRVTAKLRENFAKGPSIDIDIKLREPDTEFSDTVRVTPGAHIVTAKWNVDYIITEAVSVYGIDQALSTTLSFHISFTPVNPMQWKRLDGTTSISDSGLSGSSQADYKASFHSSYVDVIIGGIDGKLYLVANKGDGSYAEPVLFSDGNGEPCANLIVRKADPFGRSSVFATSKNRVLWVFNDGIRAFVNRNVPVTLAEEEEIYTIDAADLQNDRWVELILGLRNKIKLVTIENGNSHDIFVESQVAGEPIESLLCSNKFFTSDDSSRTSIAALKRLSGQGVIYENNGNNQFTPRPINELTNLNYYLQPNAVALTEILSGQERLAIALRQKKEIKLWHRDGSSWSPDQVVQLPVRPLLLINGPKRTSGLIIIPFDGNSLWLIKWKSAGQNPDLFLVNQGEGAMKAASCEDVLVVSNNEANKILIYQ